MHGGDALLRLIGGSDSLIRALKTICFVAGTPIATEAGLRPIEEIQVGELVWAFDFSVGVWVLRPVVETYCNTTSGRFAKVRAGNEELTSTDGHPYWVVSGRDLESRPMSVEDVEPSADNRIEGRWVDAAFLQTGDVLLLRGAGKVAVQHVELFETRETVYNFHVEGLENYSVGEAGILVHNANKKCQLRDSTTGRFVSDPANPPSNYKFTDAQRRAAWMKLREDPNSPLTESQRAEIKNRGNRGPQRENEYGEIETMELSHEPIPLREGGTEVFPRWPADHAAIDPHRKLKKR